MTEQRKRKLVDVGTRPQPRTVTGAHWVAVRFEDFGPWHVVLRSSPAFTDELWALPHDNPVYGLCESGD